jgi:LAO/AO transport system kinase
MVDFFLVLLLPGGGDELQGIKKGVLEIADMIAINKADGDALPRARQTAADYLSALHILTPRSATWSPPVVCISGLNNIGLEELWRHIAEHKEKLTQTGEFSARRRQQAVKWMHDMIEQRLSAWLRSHKAARERLPELETAVREGRMTPALAAADIVSRIGLPQHSDVDE